MSSALLIARPSWSGLSLHCASRIGILSPYKSLVSALGGTRIPNLLIRSQKCLNGVLTGGFAGQG
jgi:hypothetical protein